MGVPSNQLIIDMATIISESQRMASYGNDDPERLPGSLSVFVADPLDIDKVFERIVNLPEVYGKGFSITMGTEGFEEILASLKTMQGLVFTLIVIIAVVSMVILAILLTIWSRERVKEIGIFLSSGIKKIEIITQFIVEALLIAVVAFAISLPISQVVANGVGHFIITQFADAEELKNDVDEQASENSSKADGLIKLIEIKDDLLNGPAPIIENPIDQIFVAVHAHYLMWVYLIGLPVVIGSVLIACLSIVRLKPKQILSKMS
jgi:putative ABC transport system permease protein